MNRENDPSPERLARAGYSVAMQLGTGHVQVIGPARGGPIGGDGICRLSQAPLDRLYMRDQLSVDDPRRNDELFQAGDKLRNHHALAGLSGIAANDLNGTGGGHPSSRTPITETMESNRRALYRARDAMDFGDWHTVRNIVIDELTLEEAGRALGFQQRHAASAVALDRLRRGLGALAELWGYSPPRPRPEAGVPANDAGVVSAAV